MVILATDGAAVEADLFGRALGCPACEEVTSPAAAAAARAAGEAVAVCHMGAHALGAAAFASKAVGPGDPGRPGAVEDEIRWQLDHLPPEVRAALRALPPVGQRLGVAGIERGLAFREGGPVVSKGGIEGPLVEALSLNPPTGCSGVTREGW